MLKTIVKCLQNNWRYDWLIEARQVNSILLHTINIKVINDYCYFIPLIRNVPRVMKVEEPVYIPVKSMTELSFISWNKELYYWVSQSYLDILHTVSYSVSDVERTKMQLS